MMFCCSQLATLPATLVNNLLRSGQGFCGGDVGDMVSLGSESKVSIASIHILVLFGIGLNALLLGILGEYLLRIYYLDLMLDANLPSHEKTFRGISDAAQLESRIDLSVTPSCTEVFSTCSHPKHYKTLPSGTVTLDF